MEKKEIYNLGTESYSIYTGQSSPAFTPLMAGITYSDTRYEVLRPKSDIYVFEYIISGSGYIYHNNDFFAVNSGDTYILHEGAFHHYYPDKKNPFKKLWFNAKGSMIRHLLSDYGLDSIVVIPSYNDCSILEEIYHCIEENSVSSADDLAILIHRHILNLAKCCDNLQHKNSPAVSIRNFIETNLTNNLTIHMIAEHVHLSRSRTMHIFKDTYGITPYNYYTDRRMELAKTMLKRTSLSIQEIADKLGYSDYHHFSCSFKKNCGISPLKYRNSA